MFFRVGSTHITPQIQNLLPKVRKGQPDPVAAAKKELKALIFHPQWHGTKSDYQALKELVLKNLSEQELTPKCLTTAKNAAILEFFSNPNEKSPILASRIALANQLCPTNPSTEEKQGALVKYENYKAEMNRLIPDEDASPKGVALRQWKMLKMEEYIAAPVNQRPTSAKDAVTAFKADLKAAKAHLKEAPGYSTLKLKEIFYKQVTRKLEMARSTDQSNLTPIFLAACKTTLTHATTLELHRQLPSPEESTEKPKYKDQLKQNYKEWYDKHAKIKIDDAQDMTTAAESTKELTTGFKTQLNAIRAEVKAMRQALKAESQGSKTFFRALRTAMETKIQNLMKDTRQTPKELLTEILAFKNELLKTLQETSPISVFKTFKYEQHDLRDATHTMFKRSPKQAEIVNAAFIQKFGENLATGEETPTATALLTAPMPMTEYPEFAQTVHQELQRLTDSELLEIHNNIKSPKLQKEATLLLNLRNAATYELTHNGQFTVPDTHLTPWTQLKCKVTETSPIGPDPKAQDKYKYSDPHLRSLSPSSIRELMHQNQQRYDTEKANNGFTRKAEKYHNRLVLLDHYYNLAKATKYITRIGKDESQEKRDANQLKLKTISAKTFSKSYNAHYNDLCKSETTPLEAPLNRYTGKTLAETSVGRKLLRYEAYRLAFNECITK